MTRELTDRSIVEIGEAYGDAEAGYITFEHDELIEFVRAILALQVARATSADQEPSTTLDQIATIIRHKTHCNAIEAWAAAGSVINALDTAVPADQEPACTCDASVGIPHDESCLVTSWAREQFRKSGESAQAPHPEAQSVRDAWVSVDERLPPKETTVVILRNGLVQLGERRTERPTYEDNYEAFDYWDDPNDDGQDWGDHEVTHWMPMPTPPKDPK